MSPSASSLTGVCVSHALAALAVDVAAPDELALAALDMSLQVCVITTAAAQQVAAVRTARRPVAATPPGAGHAPQRVFHAVVGRPVQVNELVFVHGVSSVLPPHLPPGAV